jgi:L-fuculose-phosphate aldolase
LTVSSIFHKLIFYVKSYFRIYCLNTLGEPIFVPFSGDIPSDASSEYRVHLAVYRKTPYRAIVHAHPPFAVAASLVMDEIIPLDSEGEMFCPRIPVLAGAPGTQHLADIVAEAMVHARLVIARGHGTFAAGATLDEVYILTSLAEHASKVIAFKNIYAQKSGSFIRLSEF